MVIIIKKKQKYQGFWYKLSIFNNLCIIIFCCTTNKFTLLLKKSQFRSHKYVDLESRLFFFPFYICFSYFNNNYNYSFSSLPHISLWLNNPISLWYFQQKNQHPGLFHSRKVVFFSLSVTVSRWSSFSFSPPLFSCQK